MSMQQRVKFPKARLDLSNIDGNVFVLIGATKRALRHGGATEADVEVFAREAMSGDYVHALQTIMAWVETEF